MMMPEQNDRRFLIDKEQKHFAPCITQASGNLLNHQNASGCDDIANSG